MIGQRADLVAYDASGQLALVVEVKNRLGTTREWAAQLRRNILAHGLLPDVPYFLLALPDRFYLWKDVPNSPEPVEPDYEIDPAFLLRPYFERLGVAPEGISEASFALIIISLLTEGLQFDGALSGNSDSFKDFTSTGLFEALEGGKLYTEPLA